MEKFLSQPILMLGYLACLFMLIILLIIIFYQLYIKSTCAFFKEEVGNLDDKVVLITGANSGIGKETAKFMAKKGAKIIMACRNMKTAAEARNEIIGESGNLKVFIFKLDLSSFNSIREFAAEINKTQEKIDILIHNAGYGSVKNAKTVDNIEMTMAVNCYGPFLLTHLLIDLMKKSAPSKIVTVASKAYMLSNFDPQKSSDLNPIDFWCPLYLYASSKFASFLLTYELSRRLKGTGVTANILHPGTFNSPIWDKNTPWYLRIFTQIGKLFMKNVEQACQTTLYASLSRNVEGLSGRYFRDCKEIKSSERTYDERLQKIMWNEAQKIVKLTSFDPEI